MSHVGIDGCPAGWVAASDEGVGLFHRIDDLMRHFKFQDTDHGDAVCLIDIPMGLPQTVPRDIEALARQRLIGKGSSVFAVPSRAAVYADDYRAACDLNLAAFGKKLSMQVWNICPKIREVDTYLQSTEAASTRLIECHPELTFSILARKPLAHRKKEAEGVAERLTILESFLPDVRDRYEDALERFRRKDMARDDIIDALALFVCARQGYELLASSMNRDEQGIPIRMAVPVSS